jgi:tetratricopeptide (TPR) repeat protein
MQQRSSGTAVRVVLAIMLFASAIFAYGGIPGMTETPIIVEQPRRLASAFLQSLSFEASTSKTTKDAARTTVAHLRLRGLRHRLARLDEGEDGLLDDDRDSAKIQGFLSRAKAYAQRQQFEKAAKFFSKGVHMAEGVLDDLQKDKTGPVEIDDAQHQLTDAVMRAASFYLERGQTVKARKTLDRADTVIQARTDAIAMRCRLLLANAYRDAGKLEEAVAAYEALFEKIREESKQASPVEQAMLDEIAAEAEGEYAREMIAEGKLPHALKLLEETMQTFSPSLISAQQGPPTLLAARLKGWLAFANLKQGKPSAAVDLIDASLAGVGELPAGLAGATAEVQELLQTRAMAKVDLGRLHSAAEDLEVLRGLQDELKKTISDEHNPKYANGDGHVPDPRLWASIARTKAIDAQMKFQMNSAKEALPLARQARQLLREVKKSDGRLPKGYNLATFAEIKEMIAKFKRHTSEVHSEDSGKDDSEHSETEEDVPVQPLPVVLENPVEAASVVPAGAQQEPPAPPQKEASAVSAEKTGNEVVVTEN